MSKVALVTGGSGGIGRAICLQLAKDGYDVCVHYNSNRLAAEAVCREVEAFGRKAVAIGGDLGDS
ncbi:MAG: SDR family NAD(P)-dependent oxidoreductase, partial [Eubacteriales bacterium]|nr:SDR family NAD(P)-dependent oxidoreductase [Eubacteriales bacterium]